MKGSSSRQITSGCSRRLTTCAKGCAHSSRSARRTSRGGEHRGMTATAAMTSAFPGTRAWLHRLSIRTFRNLTRVELMPPAEGIAVIGENGQGKSNLLEAIYYLQILRSFRGARDRELVGFGAPGFHLSADVHGGRAREVA